MAILGLMTAEQLGSTYRPKNVRRKVFYMQPNGSAPLIGLLSMMKEEVTNDPEFKWYEKRMVEQRTTLAYFSSTISYATVDASFTFTTASADVPFTAGTQYGIKVAPGGTAQFHVNHVIKFISIVSGGTVEVQGRVTYVDATNNQMAFISLATPATTSTYNAANTGSEVLAIGTAQAEGALSSSGTATTSTLNVYNPPISVNNFTQIFTENWQITGTAGKTSVWFDTRGVDPDQSKEAAVNHNRNMEMAFIFGTKSEIVVTATNVTRTTGGVLYFLRLWEAGSTYSNTAATADTDDNKRIITNSSGVISAKTYNKYLERGFRFNRNKQNELLCFCGNGFMNTLAEMYAGKQTFTVQMPSTNTFGMTVTAHQTSFGTVYYKTHPLFNLNSTLRFNGLFLDVTTIKYRPMAGRDTTLKKNQQPNNADYVEDGFITEAGYENASPESSMYIQNVTDYSP